MMPTQPLVTLLCGPAGAGKTTYARTLEAAGALRLSMDEAAWADGWRDRPPPPERVPELDAELQEQLARSVARGRDVVVDLSCSTRHVRDVWRELADRAGARLRLVVLSAPLDVLLDRVAAREGVAEANSVHLSPATVRTYVEGFEWPGADEPHEVIRTAP